MEVRDLLTVITVDSLLDNFDLGMPTVDGMITLREAILAADTDSVIGDAPAGNGADQIDFATSLFVSGPQTIEVARAHSVTYDPTAFEILSDLTITGPDAGLLTIDVSHLDPTPDSTLDDGVIDNDGDGARAFLVAANVTMSGMTLTGGDVFRYGGAIWSGGNLSLTDMTISGNFAGTEGGGIDVPVGDLVINNSSSSISNNASGDRGGGIYFATLPGYAGSMSVADSVISGNRGADGGGIAAIQGTDLTIVHSTITDNTAGASIAVGSHGEGGGIFASSTLTIQESTISSNLSTGQGGGGIALSGSSALRALTTVKRIQHRRDWRCDAV